MSQACTPCTEQCDYGPSECPGAWRPGTSVKSRTAAQWCTTQSGRHRAAFGSCQGPATGGASDAVHSTWRARQQINWCKISYWGHVSSTVHVIAFGVVCRTRPFNAGSVPLPGARKSGLPTSSPPILSGRRASVRAPLTQPRHSSQQRARLSSNAAQQTADAAPWRTQRPARRG